MNGLVVQFATQEGLKVFALATQSEQEFLYWWLWGMASMCFWLLITSHTFLSHY
jgi:hypothetical protein